MELRMTWIRELLVGGLALALPVLLLWLTQ